MNWDSLLEVNMKTDKVLKDQSGVALVIALLMIIVISLIGLASSSSSIFEVKLSGNKRGATDAFYTADGGAQSVLANIGNFNTSSGYVAVTTGSLPLELQTESIDQRFASPGLSLPSGISFNDPPQVIIYHTTKDSVPRGSGFSATNFEYSYYIIDSVGRDQMDLSLNRSNCEIRQKMVRVIPTLQGGY
jgi:Tfp pilus assembly protein PilX